MKADSPVCGVRVRFYSYFRDLTGCHETTEVLPPGSTVATLLGQLYARFPRLEAMQNAILVAVRLDYAPKTWVLKPDDEVALFPPVQGG